MVASSIDPGTILWKGLTHWGYEYGAAKPPMLISFLNGKVNIILERVDKILICIYIGQTYHTILGAVKQTP